ncbi:uncharacterized protein LTR77_010998 [Saxophila tyrrhenica]|uniref:Peptide hydrolase n=1 Tax=Saxophila tyrrhenica TaxID=1690608 RepID=A0AAV9NWH3_9PEZI|nr:hypothetical protein LTR77_010998 [Saxophila tyrrhenica]
MPNEIVAMLVTTFLLFPTTDAVLHGNVYTHKDTWPSPAIGSPLRPQRPSLELQEMLAEIDPERIEHTVTTLVGFRTRHTLSTQESSTEGIGAARDWIYHTMKANAGTSDGTVDVYLNSYIQEAAEFYPFSVNVSNVVTQVNGTVDPSRAYVVTAHYDSRRLDLMDFTGDAPGADDDATGVAVVMELARVMTKRKPKATVVFAATAGEEQGYQGASGSAHLARTLRHAGYDVQGNWNNDIVGTGKNTPFSAVNDFIVRVFGASIYYPNTSSAQLREQYSVFGDWNDSPAHNLGRFIREIAAGAARALRMRVELVYRPDRMGRGGDHYSFLAEGFPAVRFTESVEDFAHQHQDPRVENGVQFGDLLEFVDFEYTTRVARTNLASMWSAANAPSTPRNVGISMSVGALASNRSARVEDLSNKSQFCWATGHDSLAVGYELVWRPSGSLDWTHYLNVGHRGTVTVDLPKDDLQFGVRAVGKNNMKSPAVLPVPIDSC